MAEIQLAIDKAVRLGVDSKNEHERVRFKLENILILGEHLVEHSYDIMSDAARIYQHSHKDSKPAPNISIPKMHAQSAWKQTLIPNHAKNADEMTAVLTATAEWTHARFVALLFSI